jgi:hypothetical protein
MVRLKEGTAIDQGSFSGLLGMYPAMPYRQRISFARWFWCAGLVLWLTLAIAFGLHRNWHFFALSVVWVMASLAGWSRSDRHVGV